MHKAFVSFFTTVVVMVLPAPLAVHISPSGRFSPGLYSVAYSVSRSYSHGVLTEVALPDL